MAVLCSPVTNEQHLHQLGLRPAYVFSESSTVPPLPGSRNTRDFLPLKHRMEIDDTSQRLAEASNSSTFKLQFMLTSSPAAPLINRCVIIYAVFFFLWLIFFPRLIFPPYVDGEGKQAAFYDFTAIINPLYELEAGEQPVEKWLTEVTDSVLRAYDLWALPSGPPPPCAQPSPADVTQEQDVIFQFSRWARCVRIVWVAACVCLISAHQTLHLCHTAFFLWVCLVFVVLRVRTYDEIKWYSTQNPLSIKHWAPARSLVSTLMKSSSLFSVTDGGFIMWMMSEDVCFCYRTSAVFRPEKLITQSDVHVLQTPSQVFVRWFGSFGNPHLLYPSAAGLDRGGGVGVSMETRK